jgi:hypothetical protein
MNEPIYFFIGQLFWLIFLFMFIFPIIQAQMLQWSRERILKAIEEEKYDSKELH